MGKGALGREGVGIFLPSLCVRAVKLNGRICRFGALGDFTRMFKGGRRGEIYTC